MVEFRRRYSEVFKRRVVARIAADPNGISSIAHELGIARSLVYKWRQQYAVSPPQDHALDVSAIAQDQHLRQSLRETAAVLVAAIRASAEGAPLNQLSASLGLVVDRMLILEALNHRDPESAGQGVIRIEYLDPDGSLHASPPWARGDPAFESPITPGRLQSPFWGNQDSQTDDAEDDPARG